MSKALYFLTTFLDSGLSVVGIRSPYDQPKYTVLQTLAPNIEIRKYEPRTVVETNIVNDDEGQAFGRLFRYITGANKTKSTIAMTVPVERSTLIAMTAPVEIANAARIMRFYLPPKIAKDPPTPTDPDVRLEALPTQTLAVIRYNGTSTEEARTQETEKLRVALAKAQKTAAGTPLYFSYDPPFAIPYLRRNEIAFEVK